MMNYLNRAMTPAAQLHNGSLNELSLTKEDGFHLRSFACSFPIVLSLSKDCVLFLFLFFIILTTQADTSPQPALRDLDRMFTTRYERAQLDAMRHRISNGEAIDAPATNTANAPPAQVEMQGIMQRENGSSVTWVNGQSTIKSNNIDDHIRVSGQPQALHGANITIDGQTVRLKPGQVWQPDTRTVVESYRTKVVVAVTKGADEKGAAVQTENPEKIEPKPPDTKPEAMQAKP